MDCDEMALRKLCNGIAERINCDQTECPATEAVQLLIRRILEAGETFRILGEHAEHDWTLDGCVLLRGTYDAMLQALYIIQSPVDATNRGKRYLDFEWIERHNLFEALGRSSTSFARRVMSGPTQQANETAVRAEIARILPQFLNQKGKPFLNWYAPTKLDTLAMETGYIDEYTIMQKMLSGVVHSSPYWLKHRSVWPQKHYQSLSISLFLRVLGKLAAFKSVELTENERSEVESSYENVLDA